MTDIPGIDWILKNNDKGRIVIFEGENAKQSMDQNRGGGIVKKIAPCGLGASLRSIAYDMQSTFQMEPAGWNNAVSKKTVDQMDSLVAILQDFGCEIIFILQKIEEGYICKLCYLNPGWRQLQKIPLFYEFPAFGIEIEIAMTKCFVIAQNTPLIQRHMEIERIANQILDNIVKSV
jgi:hypothetical protein